MRRPWRGLGVRVGMPWCGRRITLGGRGASARHARAIVLAGMLLGAGCFSSDPAATGGAEGDVTIEMTSQLTYSPVNATARVGQTVRWVNQSNSPHTVTADPELAVNAGSVSLPPGAEPFGSDLLTTGGAFTHTFTVAGTYRYFCRPHEGSGMIGTIVITE